MKKTLRTLGVVCILLGGLVATINMTNENVRADAPFATNVDVHFGDTIDKISPSFVVDNGGNVFVVYEYDEGAFDSVKVTQINGFLLGVQVDDVSGTAHKPDIAIDSGNDLYVVYDDVKSGDFDIYFTKSTDGGWTWTSPVRVNSASAGDQWEASLSVSDDGSNIYVTWTSDLDGDGLDFDTHFAKSTNGGLSFDTNIKLNDDSTAQNQRESDVVVFGTNVYASWTDERNMQSEVWFTRSINGGTSFDPNLMLNDVDIRGVAPSLDVDSTGNVSVAFYGYGVSPLTGWNVYFSKSTNGGSVFTSNTLVNDIEGGAVLWDPRGLGVGVDDSSGKIHVVWQDERSSEGATYYDIYCANSTDGGVTFNNNLRVNDDVFGNRQNSPRLVIGQDGTAHMVWIDERDGNKDIYYSYLTGLIVNNPPNPPTNISPGSVSPKEWFSSSPITVSWTHSDPESDPQVGADIDFSSDSGFSWTDLYYSTSYSSSTYDWNSPPEDGELRIRVKTYDGSSWSTDWGISAYDFGFDSIKPTSSVSPLPAYETTLTFDVAYSANDAVSGVLDVELFYRKDSAVWNNYGTFTSSPISFTASSDGTYEFYTRVEDYAGNIEMIPGTPDASTIVDTANPTSNVDPLPSYESVSSFTVTATASDTNGISQVDLWYSKDSGSWTLYDTDVSSPWSWSFDASTTGGDGLYEFYTIATDNPGNVESDPVTPDTSTIVDTTGPVSSANTLPSYETVSSFTMTASAMDLNGVMKVELWYNRDGTGWQNYGEDLVSPWSWNFDTSTVGGDGQYQFYTRAYDSIGNYEDPPGTNDSWTVVDTTKPTSSADSLSTYTTSTVFTVTATASDTNGISQVDLWYSKDSGSWTLYDTDVSSPWSWSFDASTTGGDGLYEFYTIATDNPGNVEVAPGTVEASTMVDTQKPAVSDKSPTGTDAPVGTTITVTFSEAMDHTATEGAFSILPSVSGSMSWSGLTLTFTPTTSLTHSTQYEVTIGTGAQDLAGNNLQSPYPWQFITTSASDATPPTVSDTTPTGSDAQVGTTITVTFSEPMNQTATEEAFSVSPSVVGTFSWSATTLTFTPTSPLSYETLYEVTMGTGATDLAGNSLELPYSWQFTTTSTSDTTPPTVTGKSPTGIDVPVGTTITVTFSEAMDHTATEGAFSTFPGVEGTFSWSATTLTFTPDSDLRPATDYSVTIGVGAKDSNGNNLQSPYSWEFITETHKKGGDWYWLVFLIIIVLATILVIFLIKRKKKSQEVPREQPKPSKTREPSVKSKQAKPKSTEILPRDEKFQKLESMFQEGKISEETYESLKRKYELEEIER